MKESEIYAMAIKDIIALEKTDDAMDALEFLFNAMRLAKYSEEREARKNEII